MKYGNFWTSTIGAGVVIAGMMTAGHTAMKSPAFLFMAGQVKVAVGQTDAGLRLMNAATSQRNSETDKVHAAEKPASKPDNEVCTNNTNKKTTGSTLNIRPAATREAKTQTPAPSKPVAVMAKLDIPNAPFAPAVNVHGKMAFDPVAFQYLNESQRKEIVQAQIDSQRIQQEMAKKLRRAVFVKYVPSGAGVNPPDISHMERELPATLGQMTQ